MFLILCLVKLYKKQNAKPTLTAEITSKIISSADIVDEASANPYGRVGTAY